MIAISPKPWYLTQPSGGFAEIRDANDALVFCIAYPSLGMGDPIRPERVEANAEELIRCLNGGGE